MPVNLDSLPPQVRPVRCAHSPQAMYLLTGDTWAPSLCTAIDGAQDRIRLIAYSVSARWPKTGPDRWNVWRSLLAAPLRGVHATAVLAAHKPSGATRYFNLRAAQLLADCGWNIRHGFRSRLVHAKMIIIDDEVCFLGSHNFSYSASVENVDLSIMIQGRESIRPMLQFAQDLWSSCGQNR